MQEGRVVVGHPVDVGSGAVYTLSTDFRVPGVLALPWTRYYSSAATCDSWLGPKWSVPYFMSLQRHSDRYVLIGSHAEEVSFASPTGPLREGAMLVNESAQMELCREAGRYSVLHWHTGAATRRFNFQERDRERMPLDSVENVRGQRIRVEYDPKGRPVRFVQELERRTAEVTYDRSDLISAVHFLATSRRKLLVQYEYDSHRRLTTARDALGQRKDYDYDGDNRIIAETNPLGSRFVFEYDRLGRCVRTSGVGGYLERKLHYRAMPRATRVTDSRGAVTQYYLNAAGQVLQIVYPLGGVKTNTFDEHGRLIEAIYPDGAKESYVYDQQGNRCATVDACGAKTTVEHNDQHVPTRLVDRNGTAWDLDKP
jgi:YD repeat-containing protein